MIFKGKLIKVKADSTNKQFYVLIMLACFLLFLIICFIANYLIPNVFLDLNGLENCPEDFTVFKGFCHHLDLGKTNRWEVYIGGVDRNNQILWITGEAIKEGALIYGSATFELEFKSRVSF